MKITELRRANVRNLLRTSPEYRRRMTGSDAKLTELGESEFVDLIQPAMDEFDPVVQMAMVGADYEQPIEIRLRALEGCAPYMRPKLKQVEHLEDPAALAAEENKRKLSERLVQLLETSSGRRSAREEVTDVTYRVTSGG